MTEDVEKSKLKRRKDLMTIRELLEELGIHPEDSGREMVEYLLEQRGYKCVAERLRLDADYELDIYCNAGVLTAVGKVKVRAGGSDVEKVFERAQELLRRWPEKISGRLVPVLYTLLAEPSAIQKARELGVWLIESKREVVTLEEVLGRT
ncbi:MAG: hypothetical protein GU356_02255 [Pyrobaculum sp.]|jgi:hypothetical protein|nr:hypothetical protein [Pyrobaculum sp.]